MTISKMAGVLGALLVLGWPAQAQHHSSKGEATAMPYAGLETRRIKALSDQQIADLMAGRGMGLALAAELNGYPGPLHVLEHAETLHLSEEQRSQTIAMIDAMKAETVAIGERMIMKEAELDRLFSARVVSPALLETVVSQIAAAQGELRVAHLRYHLKMVELLSPAQFAHYATLRGYSRGSQ